MSEKILEIKNLRVVYKGDVETVEAVNGINLEIEKGGTLGLVGETGAGKTTTALSIMRLMPEVTGRILSGEIIFEEKDLLKIEEAEMRKVRGDKIAMVFQDPMTSLNPVHTIGSQIGEAIKLHNEHMTEEQVQKKVEGILNMVGINAERKHDYPHQFSGGMKQRVVIAIALSCEPDLLIADEPTTALDVTIQAQVLAMIRDLRDRLGTSMLMITHDLGIVAQTCDHVAVMYAGQIIEFGTAEDIFNGKKHHPYTEGLFGSIPNLKSRAKRLNPIPGLMPDPIRLPEGCYFAPRCTHCREICKTVRPEAMPDSTHKIACHLYNEKYAEEMKAESIGVSEGGVK